MSRAEDKYPLPGFLFILPTCHETQIPDAHALGVENVFVTPVSPPILKTWPGAIPSTGN